MLLYPPGLEFIVAFFGCLLAGVIAVPAYPPRIRRDLGPLRSIAGDACPALALTTATLRRRIESWERQLEDSLTPRWLVTDTLDPADGAGWSEPEPASDAVAMLQFTSGSTSTPKGVMVSHANLADNQRRIQRAFAQDEDSVVVGWLPLYHDMGLVGNVLQPLYLGGSCLLMSPVAFLQKPLRWLRAISEYRATTSGGPNFAYDLCVDRITPADRAELDLSSWRTAFNGAEPVRVATLERFAATFAPQGFRRSAFQPCYGLAEATLLVTAGSHGKEPVTRTLEAAALERDEARVLPQGVPQGASADAATKARTLVGCGPVPAAEVCIVAPGSEPSAGRPCGPGEVGEIWVTGAGVAQGYWQRPEASRETFGARLAEGDAPYLRTGDLGFLLDGELFITGRIKDLIILRGRNLYPQDIERAAEVSHPQLRPGGVAAFSVEGPHGESLVVVQELNPRVRESDPAMVEAIRHAIATQFQAQVHEVVLVRAGTVPKTSSGKVQRRKCRRLYQRGELEPLLSSVAAETAEVLEAELPDRDTLAGLEPEELTTLLRSFLRDTAARLLRVSRDELEEDVPLTALGLDSLMVIDLRGELESALGVAPAFGRLLQGPTLSDLAAELAVDVAEPAEVTRQGGESGAAEAADPDQDRSLTANTGPGDHPASAGQRSLWFMQRLAPDGGAQNVVFSARSRQPLPPQPLRRSLEGLVERHGALRTTLHADEAGGRGDLLQRVHPPDGAPGVEFQEVAAEGWSEAQQRDYLESEAVRPFDLEHGPLLRAHLLRGGSAGDILLVVSHQVAVDFWSFGVLLDDWRQLLTAHRLGEPSPLPPVALQYADFSRRQDALLATAEGERLRAFWLRRQPGTDAAPALELPTDGVRRATPLRRAGTVRGAWSDGAEEVAAALRAAARERGVTPYSVVLTVLGTLLHRVTGQNIVSLGSPASGRTVEGSEGVVGYLMNPLSLPLDFSSAEAWTFDHAMQRVRERVVESLEHQDYPSHLLAEAEGRAAAGPQGGRFPVFLTFNRPQHLEARGLGEFSAGLEGARLRLGGLELEPFSLDFRQTLFDLHWNVVDGGRGLGVDLQYDEALFEATTARRWLRWFQRLLTGALVRPEARLTELPLLSSAQRQQLVAEWSAPPALAVDGLSVHERFARQAQRSPEAVAIRAQAQQGQQDQQDQRWTYRQLDRRATALAHHLRTLGAGPETRVGLFLERSPEAVVAILAILKSGAAYVPMDPAYPAERIAWMLEDGEAVAVVSRRALAERLPEDCPTVWLEDLADLPGLDDREQASLPAVDLRTPAYVLYTSGSTGLPKGVLVSHAGLSAYTAWAAQRFHIDSRDRVLQFASLSFDTSAEEIFPCLGRGATLVLRDDAMLASLPRFLAGCREPEISVLDLPTAFWGELVAALAEGEALPPSVRLVIIGGEKAEGEQVAGWQRHAPQGVVLLNTYGPTEATIVACVADVSRGPAAPRVPIGRPIDGMRGHVLGPDLRPAPPGSAGELTLAGRGLARGYLGRPALTAERFRPDPFSRQAGERLYRTGDRVRHRPDGALEFLGRVDHQVKIRGYRVEIGEVEVTLAGHPAVDRAAVVARTVTAGDTRLTGYAEVAADAADAADAVDGRALRTYLTQRLPRYMVPEAVLVMDALPLTAGGKVDRRALPEVAAEEVAAGGHYQAPRTPNEEILVGICAEVLNLERISVEDDLFELGCHSLLATKIIARASEAFGVEVPLVSLFEAPTVAALARTLEAGGTVGSVNLPPIKRVPRGGDLPLSLPQERLWFLHQLDPESGSYHVPRALRMRGALSVELVNRAYTEIVRRHEVLRTIFPTVEGRPVQVIKPADRVPIPAVDLSGLPADQREGAVRRFIRAEGCRPFDLAQGPLLRLCLARIADDDHVLIQTEHHLVHDGWTQAMLVREFLTLYTAFYHDQPSPLPELPVQYADFAAWQQRWMRDEMLAPARDYWLRSLEDAPPVLELATDRPRPPVASTQGNQIPFDLPAPLAERVRTLGQKAGATLFMTLLSAYYCLMYRFSGQRDLCVGTGIANRRVQEAEGLLGMVINTLVLRSEVEADGSFAALLDQVRKVCLQAYAHQDMPFERLVELLQPQRSLSYTPLFQVFFVFMDAPMPALELPEVDLEVIDAHNRSAKFDMNVTVIPHREQRAGSGQVDPDGRVTVLWEYATDIFDPTTMERMVRCYQNLLTTVVEDPQQSLAALPLLDSTHRHQLLVEWNDTEFPLPEADTLAAQVAARRARTPQAVALRVGDRALRYGELDARVRRLAERLRRVGVGPEVCVGVLLPRSEELVVALLAVLQAGGTYVPLDPDYPAERAAFMLEDSAAAVLLTLSSLRPAFDGPVLALDEEDLTGGPEPPPAASFPAPSPEGVAYVIYTSGSTGRPKGVMIRQSSAAALVAWAGTVFSPEELSGVLASTSVCFDLSIFELFVPLAHGGTVILAANVLELAELPAAREVRLINTVPSAMAQLLRLPGGLPPGVKTVNLAGEPLRQGLVQDLRATGVARVLNLYGPSEDTTYSTFEEQRRDAEPTIGRPVAGTRAYVLGEALRPVPVGVVGELCLGGLGVARGYRERPRRTARAFVPNPVQAGGRLYRTGDQARLLPDGRLQFLGRRDHQVKVRGYRIELEEIEAALVAHPQVDEAAVVVVTNDQGEPLLAAYIAPQERVPDIAVLQDFLGERLPRFMVPTSWTALEALPRTPNDKLDRAALPALRDTAGRSAAGTGTRRRSAMERAVAEIWKAELGVSELGMEDGFFELGGHSLMAARIRFRVQEEFGIDLDLRRFFERPTVAAMARDLEERRGREAGAFPPLEARSLGEEDLASLVTAMERYGEGEVRRRLQEGELPVEDPPAETSLARRLAALPTLRARLLNRLLQEQGEAFGIRPCSFAQRRMWLLDRLLPDNAAMYNIPGAVRLEGDLDLPALGRALGELVARHEVLRTTFVAVGGTPSQRIHSIGESVLPVVDLSDLPSHLEALALARRQGHRPFDLERGPLLRVALYRLAPGHHLLSLVLHHILSDGWSQGILVRELGALYRAALGESEGPAPLPLQYGDTARWQQESWRRGAYEGQLNFWRKRLEDVPPEWPLPRDRPRPVERHYRSGSQEVALPAAVASAVDALARERGATRFLVLLAGFAALLYRTTGQTRGTVGTPVANRDRAETAGLIGLFVNTLALPVEIETGEGFASLLDRLRRHSLEAFAHQELPFEQLVEALQPDRRLDTNPLFQVMFSSVEGGAVEALTLPGLRLEAVVLDNALAKLDLAFEWVEGGGPLRLRCEYDTDLFDATTVQRLADQALRLLTAALVAPRQSLETLPFLTPAQHHQLLTEWAFGAAVPRTEELAHEVIADHARRRPQAPALVAEEESLTYGELMQRVERLADHLRRLGAGSEQRVALLAERSPAVLVAMLAVLRSGAAYVPIDPGTPPQRLADLLEDAGARLFLTRPEATPEPPSGVRAVSYLETPPEAGALPPVALSPENTAYVIYTSGSTGRPKGVPVRHRSLAAYGRTVAGIFGLTPKDRLLQFASLSFDTSIEEIFSSLMTGATLVLRNDAMMGSAARFLEQTAAAEVSVLTLPTAFWGELVAALERDAALPPSLRLMVIGGERALPEWVMAWQRIVGGRIPLLNSYGPTEVTVVATVATVEEDAAGLAAGVEVEIGRPIANARTYILDPDLRPVPPGSLGELHVGGIGLSRGYLGRPGRTAAAFLPDPFAGRAGEPGSRLYATGDLVRHRPDGRIEYRGRRDHQVKIRGYRVELGEVENLLATHPRVEECVVLDRPAPAGNTALVAYVGTADSTLTEQDLRDHLAARLPPYMVPVGIGVLPALPRTASEKVDRSTLPPLELGSGAAASAPPRTPTEELVAGVWEEVLGVAGLGVQDDFFALGGHSLQATQVLSRLGEALGQELSLRAFFERPTVAGLAAELERARQAVEGLALPPLEPRPRRGETLPLSSPQQRLWFLEQMQGGLATYVLPVALRLEGPLDPAGLAAAVADVVRRQEALRTRFGEQEGEPVQEVVAAVPAPLPCLDLTAVAASRRSATAEELARRLARLPFDLGRAPLLRGWLLRLEPQQHLLVLSLHHIVSDGWSLMVLAREVTHLYAAYRQRRQQRQRDAGHPEPPEPLAVLPPLPVQYGDYALWQQSWLAGEVLDRHLDFWRDWLDGAPQRLALPIDRPRSQRRSAAGARRRHTLPTAVVERLDRLAREHGVTRFMALLAVFEILLGWWTGEDDFLLGTEVANRDRTETEGLIGFFVNQLALRADLGGDPSFEALLRRVRKTTLAAYDHRSLPFERLVEALQPERDGTTSPLFQVNFSMPDMPQQEPDIPGLTVRPFEVATDTSKLDLMVSVLGLEGELTVLAEYSTGLFDGATIDRLLERFAALLAHVCEHPEASVSELRRWLAAQDREQWQKRRPALPGARPAARPLALEPDAGEETNP